MTDSTTKALSETEIPIEEAFVPDNEMMPIEEAFVPDNEMMPIEEAFVPDTEAGSGIVSSTENKGRNWVETVPLTDQELDLLAKKHGVDRGELESFAAARGGITPYKDVPTELMEAGKQALGEVGEAVLFGLPQKISQKLQTPKMEAAIEDLRDLIDSKKSRFQQGAELVGELAAGIAMPAAAVGKTGSLAATLSAGAIEGGLTGYAHAKSDEELAGTALGAGVGVTLGGVLHGAIKGLSHLAGKKAGEEATTSVNKAIEDALGEETPAVYKELDRQLEEYAPEAVTQSRLISNLSKIPEDEVESADVNKLIKEFVGNSEEELLARADKLEARSKEILDTLVEREGPRAEANMPALIREADEKAERQLVTEEASELRKFGYYLKFGKPFEGTDLSKPSVGALPKSADAELLTLLRKQKPEDIDEALLQYKTFSLLMDEASPLSKRIRELEGYDADGIQRAINWVRDGRYTAASIDRKHFGMKMAPTLDNGSMAQKAHTLFMTNALEEAKGVNKLLTNKDNWESLSYKVIQQIENPSEAASPEVKELSEKYSSLFNEWLQSFNNRAMELNGSKIIEKERGNYVPHAMMSYVDSMARIKTNLEELKTKGVDLLNSDLTVKDMLNKAELIGEGEKADQIVRAITLMGTGQQTRLKELPDMITFTKAFKEVAGGVNRAKVEDIIAKSSLAREGDIPLIIREVRLPLLAERWAINTSRAMHLQKTMKDLQDVRNKLVAVQDIPSAEFVQRLIEDLAGGSRSSLASAVSKKTEQMQIALRTAAQETDNPLKKAFFQTASEAPEYWNFLIQNLYAVYLGLPKITPVITNASTIFAYSVPELGYKYGLPTALRGYQNALRKLGNKEFKVAQYLEEAGFKGAEVSRLGELLHNTTISSNMGRTSVENIKKMNNSLMFLFEASENFNKLVSLEMADKVALDVLGGGKEAAEFLSRLQPGTKRAVKEAIDSGDYENVRNELRKYFIGKMILNYDKLNMSQLGRELGPGLSMFSKWPATMVGDVIEQFENKGIKGGSIEIARKLVMPVIIGAMLNMATRDVKDNPIVNAIKGKGSTGFVRYAPIASMGGLATGKFASSPALTPVQAGVKALAGDVGGASTDLKKFLDDVAMGVVPPVRVIRQLGDMVNDK